MEGNLKQKLLEHSVFLIENINPSSTLLWARLRAEFVIDEEEEERCKVRSGLK